MPTDMAATRVGRSATPTGLAKAELGWSEWHSNLHDRTTAGWSGTLTDLASAGPGAYVDDADKDEPNLDIAWPPLRAGRLRRADPIDDAGRACRRAHSGCSCRGSGG